MFDSRIYKSYKRIMKGDTNAIIEIESLEDAKEIIRIMAQTYMYNQVMSGEKPKEYERPEEIDTLIDDLYDFEDYSFYHNDLSKLVAYIEKLETIIKG